MDKAWQLCVVDRDFACFENAIDFELKFKTVDKDEPFPNGTIVFATCSVLKGFDALGAFFDSAKFVPRYRFMGGIMFSYVWVPSASRYGWIMQDMLRPILTEIDAIDMEIKFGINLKEWIS